AWLKKGREFDRDSQLGIVAADPEFMTVLACQASGRQALCQPRFDLRKQWSLAGCVVQARCAKRLQLGHHQVSVRSLAALDQLFQQTAERPHLYTLQGKA